MTRSSASRPRSRKRPTRCARSSTDTPEELREHALILETHLVLLKDKMLYDRTIDTIEKKRFNAEWALRTVVRQRQGACSPSMADPYLKDRVDDIVHVSDRIMKQPDRRQRHQASTKSTSA